MPDENLELETPPIDADAYKATVLENALLRAGVDLSTPQGELVRDAWKDRTPEPEAIKASWELVKPTPVPEEVAPVEQPRVEGEAGQANERRELNANSVVEPNPMDQDPRQAAIQAGLDVMNPPRDSGRQAGTNEDALVAVFHGLAEAAANGDQRVLVGYEQPAV